jgi:hypothetical protein
LLKIMAHCGHENCYIDLPPTLEFLVENFPLITPNETLDRSISRCRLCDLIATNGRQDQAVYPPPTFTNPIDGIRRHIALTEQLIGEGIRKEELETSLPLMKKALGDEIRATDQMILEAWAGHWAIWGPGEGPDLEDEYVVEENPKAPLKIRGSASKGRASGKRGRRA